MAIEDIKYATGEENPKGVIFGNMSNRKIIITRDCHDPDRIIKIIDGKTAKIADADDLDLDA